MAGNSYWEIFTQSFVNYWNYLVTEISSPAWDNYFYWLIGVSAFFLIWEGLRPWYKREKIVWQDFSLDAFYMFFNFFLFSLVGYNAVSNVAVKAFNDGLAQLGITNLVAITINTWPAWTQLLLMFVLRDFIQWNVHRLMHTSPFLWEFHKVHHSARELGFATHLRFHWMETVAYRTVEYLPLAMIGFGIQEFFLVHIIALVIGHFNHSNIYLPRGPLRYIVNNPQFHKWHHVKNLPEHRTHGINFALSLSIWDYLFGTAEEPHSGRDIQIGYPEDDEMPNTFLGQILFPLTKKPTRQPKEESDQHAKADTDQQHNNNAEVSKDT